MKVGFFSPLPPARTGVADYSAALLAEMRKQGEIEVGAEHADVALYHLGNNHLHREIYSRALAKPGVVVLHDAVLNHFFLGSLNQADYISEFVFNYGEWSRGMAEDLWRRRARSASDPCYFDHPMLRRIVTASPGVIVHNPAAARAVRAHNPAARVFEIPHLSVRPAQPDPAAVARLRASLGVGPRALLVGVFGHLRESKRVPVILRAMEKLWRVGLDAKLIVQGEFASSDLERSLAASIANHPHILRAGYLPEREFLHWAAAADVCVNLRYPTAGETSGIAITMMGIGKAVIFSAGEETSRIPENACLRVEHGAAEEDMLAGYLTWLAANPGAAQQIGRHAAEHIRREHAIDKIARQYWDCVAPPSGSTS